MLRYSALSELFFYEKEFIEALKGQNTSAQGNTLSTVNDENDVYSKELFRKQSFIQPRNNPQRIFII